MLQNSKTFGSFSVDSLKDAKQFYADTLGLSVSEDSEMGLLMLNLSNDMKVVIYPKGEEHKPATFTVLNFIVADIGEAVDELNSKGVEFEHYDDETYSTNEKGISGNMGEGPVVAWFKDPAGNILSVMQTN